jgi:hypothetical protein
VGTPFLEGKLRERARAIIECLFDLEHLFGDGQSVLASPRRAPLIARLAAIVDGGGLGLGAVGEGAKQVKNLASPCFAMSLSTLYRPRLPQGWQTIVNVGSRTSDSVKASFGISGR